MAGRGRGRGRGGLNMSSMMEPGMKAEPVVPLLVPPPPYPPLEYKPIPTTITAEHRYMIQLKKSFADYMLESPNNVLPKVIKKDIERYSDRYRGDSKNRYEDRYDWSRMPAELRSVVKKKNKSEDGGKIKKQKVVDVTAKLQELETKEATTQSDDEEEEKKNVDDEDKDDDAVEDEEDSDEEMDEGTDYVNNYFDNGEDYEEDDDKDNAEPEYS